MERSNALPRAKAREVLASFRIEEASEIDPEDFAFALGLTVETAPLVGMDGFISRRNKKATIVVKDSLSKPHKRFVIAHELGHYFLHPATRQVDLVDITQAHDWSEKQQLEEYQANSFAAELLMPTLLFKPCVAGLTPSFNTFEALARKFNTTLTATAVNFMQHTTEECIIIFSSKATRRWFISSPTCSFRLRADTRLHPYSCVYELSALNPKRYSNKIEASTWFDDFYGVDKAYITEESWYFSVYDSNLTLLWIHEAI